MGTYERCVHGCSLQYHCHNHHAKRYCDDGCGTIEACPKCPTEAKRRNRKEEKARYRARQKRERLRREQRQVEQQRREQRYRREKIARQQLQHQVRNRKSLSQQKINVLSNTLQAKVYNNFFQLKVHQSVMIIIR